MSNRKIYVSGSNPSVRVPVREVTLSNNERLRLYDTSGLYTDPDYTPDVKQGLPPLRRHWVLSRADVEPGASGRWGLRAKPGHRVTQMHYARRGEITPEMEFVAVREQMDPAVVRDEVASGRFANISEAVRNAAWKAFAEDPARELRAAFGLLDEAADQSAPSSAEIAAEIRAWRHRR